MSATSTGAPALGVPAAPPLPPDLEAMLRRLRLPHIRALAPEVIATAKAQRWEPVEVLKALFTEEAAGRERSALATRRATAGNSRGCKDARPAEVVACPDWMCVNRALLGWLF